MRKSPNFIVIYADDLGFGDLGCYGASNLPTPNLDRMAKEGIQFNQTYATAATCTPSRYSLLTGSYPWRNPKAKILKGDAPMIIDDGEWTLPKILKRANYKSAVVGKWHIGLGDGDINWNEKISKTPLDVGFDQSFIMAATNDRVPCVYIDGREVENLDPQDPLEVHYGNKNPFPEEPTGRQNPEHLKLMHNDHQHFDSIVNGVGRIGFCKGGQSAQWNDETMTDTFLEKSKQFISDNQYNPFFLYFALHQPHVPRIPSPRFRAYTQQGPRGDVIAELDWCVGQLIDTLKDLNLAEDTLVLFSSDNGPILEDGYADLAKELVGDHKPAGPLRGGKYSLFDGGTRVPTLVWGPGRIPSMESNALISQVDLLASFASLAGIKMTPNETADSLDLSEALLGNDLKGRDCLVTEGFGAKTLIRKNHWVYIPPYEGEPLFGDKGTETGNLSDPQLYDLNSDLGQRQNLADANPEKLKELASLLEDIKANSNPELERSASKSEAIFS